MSVSFDKPTTSSYPNPTVAESKNEVANPEPLPPIPTSQEITDALVMQLADQVTNEFTPNDAMKNVGKILAYILVAVENQSSMSGAGKKELALRVLYVLAQRYFPEDVLTQALIMSFADDVIDTIVAASKGNIGINQPEEPGAEQPSRGLLGCCLPFFAKKA